MIDVVMGCTVGPRGIGLNGVPNFWERGLECCNIFSFKHCYYFGSFLSRKWLTRNRLYPALLRLFGDQQCLSQTYQTFGGSEKALNPEHLYGVLNLIYVVKPSVFVRVTILVCTSCTLNLFDLKSDNFRIQRQTGQQS